jgi:hypothetical protein
MARYSVLYRATSTGFTGVGSHWTPNIEDAEAYTNDGVGHGGVDILAAVPAAADVVVKVKTPRDLADAILSATTDDEDDALADELQLADHERGDLPEFLADKLNGYYAFQVLEGDVGKRRSVLKNVPEILARVTDWIVFYEPRVGNASAVCETWRRLDDRHDML